MAYCLKITKKGGARYAQIIETFYDNVAKRSSSRSIESFGDLNKHLEKDPDFENKLRQRIVMLNQDDSWLAKARLDIQLQKQDLYLADTRQGARPAHQGLQPLNYGLALDRALWEELGLRLLLNRLSVNCLQPFPYNLDLLTLFLIELKQPPLGMPIRTLAFKDQTIINFTEISSEEISSALLFLAKRKNTILRQLRNKLLSFDKAALLREALIQNPKLGSLLSEQDAKALANADWNLTSTDLPLVSADIALHLTDSVSLLEDKAEDNAEHAEDKSKYQAARVEHNLLIAGEESPSSEPSATVHAKTSERAYFDAFPTQQATTSSAPQLVSQVESKSEIQSEIQSDGQLVAQAGSKSMVQSEGQTEVQSESQLAASLDIYTEGQADSKAKAPANPCSVHSKLQANAGLNLQSTSELNLQANSGLNLQPNAELNLQANSELNLQATSDLTQQSSLHADLHASPLTSQGAMAQGNKLSVAEQHNTYSEQVLTDLLNSTELKALLKSVEGVNMSSIQPFMGKLAYCDIHSIYVMCPEAPFEKQQMVLCTLITADGIPLDFDYLYVGRVNYFRPTANLRDLVIKLNSLSEQCGLEKVVIRVDHTYSIMQMMQSLTKLKCEYVLCQSAELLSKPLQQQLMSASSWLSLKKKEESSITNFDFAHLINEEVKPHFEQDGLSDDEHWLLSNNAIKTQANLSTNWLNILSSENLAQATHQALQEHALKSKQPLPQEPELKLSAQSEYPDYKYHKFNLSSHKHDLQATAVALWSQRRTNAERHMWALSQSMRNHYLNIAGSSARQVLEQRTNDFLKLLGNFNAAAPTDFALLKQLEHSQQHGENLDEAEILLMQQIRLNFLAGTMLFVSDKGFEPAELTSLLANMSDWECIIMQFYERILTPWDWSQLRKVTADSQKVPKITFAHYQGQIAVSFLAWQLEQWRSFRMHNLKVQVSVQALQRSLDLLSLVRWSLPEQNYWLNLDVDRIEPTLLPWSELERIFAHFNLTQPSVPEVDESLQRKLKLKLPLQQSTNVKGKRQVLVKETLSS